MSYEDLHSGGGGAVTSLSFGCSRNFPSSPTVCAFMASSYLSVRLMNYDTSSTSENTRHPVLITNFIPKRASWNRNEISFSYARDGSNDLILLTGAGDDEDSWKLQAWNIDQLLRDTVPSSSASPSSLPKITPTKHLQRYGGLCKLSDEEGAKTTPVSHTFTGLCCCDPFRCTNNNSSSSSSSSSNIFISGNQDGELRLHQVSASSSKTIGTCKKLAECILAVSICPVRPFRIALGSMEGTVKVVQNVIEQESNTSASSASSSSNFGKVLRIYSIKDGSTINTAGAARTVAWSNSGRIFSFCYQHKIVLFDENKEVKRCAQFNSNNAESSELPEDSFVSLGEGKIIDFKSHEFFFTSVFHFTFSHDDTKLLVVGAGYSHVVIVDVETLKIERKIAAPSGNDTLFCAVLTPKGDKVAVGGFRAFCRLLELNFDLSRTAGQQLVPFLLRDKSKTKSKKMTDCFEIWNLLVCTVKFLSPCVIPSWIVVGGKK